jgi:hypothetical protein
MNAIVPELPTQSLEYLVDLALAKFGGVDSLQRGSCSTTNDTRGIGLVASSIGSSPPDISRRAQRGDYLWLYFGLAREYKERKALTCLEEPYLTG